MPANEHDSEPSGQALPAGARLEEFVIERVLGSGGFGITYLAKDTSLGRRVVIKENLPAQFAWRETSTGTVRPRHASGGDADDFAWSMTNFLREAETLAALYHPGIVRVLRKFEANGTAYFIMPFVEGLAFDSLIESNKAKDLNFDEGGLHGFLTRMLDTLGYLHERGVYHRDIKPANILITNEGVPVLIDFGSARQKLSDHSMTVVESAGYTPFEQLQSRGNVGPWSDLYALGGTLVKAITGEAPPKANDRIRRDPLVPLAQRRDLATRFSATFLASIDRALMVEEDERRRMAGCDAATSGRGAATRPGASPNAPEAAKTSSIDTSATAPTASNSGNAATASDPFNYSHQENQSSAVDYRRMRHPEFGCLVDVSSRYIYGQGDQRPTFCHFAGDEICASQDHGRPECRSAGAVQHLENPGPRLPEICGGKERSGRGVENSRLHARRGSSGGQCELGGCGGLL